MSREIKFRIFEPLNKKIHYLDFALYEHNNFTQQNNWVLPTNIQCSNRDYTNMNLNAVEIMQYTGLRDKNKKEIYEGDVLVDIKASGNDKIPRAVRYDEEYALYRVPFIRNHGAWGMSNLDLGFLLRNNPDRYEIIGNIYENPELLEAK